MPNDWRLARIPVTNDGAQTLTETKTDFPYTCTLSGLPQGELDNTATVSWGDQFLDNGAFLAGGSDPFTFKSISFAETKVDDCATITDTLGGTLGTVCSTDPSPTTFTYSHDVTGTRGTCVSQDNTATFTTSTTGSASKTVKLCVGADLGVSKTANPAFTRTYNWLINKSVDKTTIRTSSSTATFNYTVVVKPGTPAYTDNGWKVTGTITVSNPNDWESITLTNVTDAVNNAGTCSITSGDVNATLAPKGQAGDSTQLGYTCTYSSAPTTGTNTATATWGSSTAFTPHGSASGTASFDFANATITEINKTVTVTDTYKGTLGTVTSPNTGTFAYPRIVQIDSNGCKPFPNTATITQTGQTSSQSVKACPTVTGLTIGYWANKNGQAAITGAGPKSGMCSLTTFLYSYAPFKDLGSTATCAQVATYVYNVIKGGGTTCASTSCNSMLKAQMLATALNVSLSKTNGNEQIDLVNGCKMIDSSTLTATCSGSESWSPAFGGATTHLSVLDMLAYAAGQYVDSTHWYGQVKATQVLAKDAFDAINNGVALAY